MNESLWVFLMKVIDKPGGLTAIASVFSSRGVNVQSLAGSSTDLGNRHHGTIVFCVLATEEKKRQLARVVERLECVLDLNAYPYDSEMIRFSAVTKIKRDGVQVLKQMNINPEITVEMIIESEEHVRYFIAGPGAPTYQLLNELQDNDLLEDISLTVSAV